MPGECVIEEKGSQGAESARCAISPVDPLRGALRIHENQSGDLFTYGLELAGDLVRHDPSKTFTNEEVGTVRLQHPHFGKVVCGHRRHRMVWRRAPVGFAGAQPIERILCAHTAGQAGINKKLRLAPSPTRKQEHRWPMAPRLELEQILRIPGMTPAIGSRLLSCFDAPG